MSMITHARPLGACLAAAAFLVVAGAGCHASPDDPAGQAKELSDPVRRENAVANIQRLYAKALADNEGNRDAAPVQAITDATVGPLTQTYIDHPEDNQNRAAIMELLAEMRDPRAIPAFIEALDWRPEVNEEQAVRAAQTIRLMDVPDDQVEPIVKKMSAALDRVTGQRGADRRMMKSFTETLGDLGHPAATDALARVAMRQSENQMFLFNILATQELGQLEDPDALPVLIKGLFLADPTNPSMRMDDVATQGLVRLGKPAIDPLLVVLRGENEEVNAIVDQQIEHMRQKAKGRQSLPSRESLLSYGATYALGSLGYTEAMEPLLAETRSEDPDRRVYGAIAMVQLNTDDEEQRKTIAEALKRVYEEVPEAEYGKQETTRAQLLANMRHLYDASFLPFYLEKAQDEDSLDDLRLEALRSFVFLANAEEVTAAEPLVEELSKEGPGRPEVLAAEFAKLSPAVALAKECDEDLVCYEKKIAEGEDVEMQKAAYMIGRLGRGDAEAIDALVAHLDHKDVQVRLAALHALDKIAVGGAPEAVAKIEELREREEGRSIWTSFKREALPTLARLESRQSSG